MASHTTSQSINIQTQFNQIQSDVIKTMIFVSAFYAVLWFPYYTYVLFLNVVAIVDMSQQIFIQATTCQCSVDFCTLAPIRSYTLPSLRLLNKSFSI